MTFGLRKAAAALALTLFGAGGCAASTVQAAAPQPDPQVVARATASAAAQVKRCYRAPRLNRDARQIATRLRVRYTPTGELAQMPVVVDQFGVTPANRPYAGTMAQAAIGAVVGCAPLRLPSELHAGGWDEFELTFSPPTFA